MQIIVTINDENDNVPQFVYDSTIGNLLKDQYLAAIPDSTPVDDVIFHVRVSRLQEMYFSQKFGGIHMCYL